MQVTSLLAALENYYVSDILAAQENYYASDIISSTGKLLCK